LLNTCPHHEFETWRLVSYFYEGLTPRDRQMVELMCNGTFEDKDPNEAMEYLDLLAENAQNWDTTGTYEAPSKTQPRTSSGGMYNLREDHDLQVKFASLARKDDYFLDESLLSLSSMLGLLIISIFLQQEIC